MHQVVVQRRFGGAGPAAALGLLLSLAGCARFEPQPLSASKLAADFQERTLVNPALGDFLKANLPPAAFTWPVRSWDLTNLTLAAFYYHPDLDVARAHWAVMKAGKRTAAERPNPTFTGLPTFDTTTGIPSPWVITSSLDIPIETAGKRRHRIALAAGAAEASRWNIASVAWGVRSRVRQSLVELYTAGEMETLLKEQQGLQAENLRLMENMRQAGVISAFDLTQARLAADATRLALHDAERQSAEARVQLADSLGLPAAALEGAALSFAGLSDLPPDVPGEAARRQALLNRADLLGAVADYAASQAALQLEIAKQYPDVHLGPGYEFDQGDNKWSLGPSITLPVFQHNQGAVAEATARRLEAAAVVNALQARIIGEIERAVAGYRATVRKTADTEALRAHLLQQEKTARVMLDAGEISRADLAALRLQLSASAVARWDAVTKSLQALGALEDSLQLPIGPSASAWERAARPAPGSPATPRS